MPGMPYMVVPSQGSGQSDEWIKLGVEAQVLNKLPDAQRFYQTALRLNPQDSIATQNLAIVFAQSSLLNEALLTIERAALMDDKHGVIQMNWALMALEADRIDDALKAARKAIEIAPNVNTRLALAMVLGTAGLPEQAIPLYNEILKEDPKHIQAGPNLCFVQTLTDLTPKELREARDRWYNINRYIGTHDLHKSVDKSLERKLRIGYMSGDFKTHSAAMIFKAVVCHHNKDNFDVFLYSTLPVHPEKDYRTKEFVECGTWREIQALDDEKVDHMIRNDKIDILVDLSGHTNGGRLGVFARKPAPIQVTAWGFAHGTGVPEIDYFFADPIAVPLNERQYYAEKIYDLPCIVTYDVPSDFTYTGVSMLPYYRNEYITFGTYARYEKMSDQCLAAFHEILLRVPNSRLQFKDNAYRRPYSIRRILEIMKDIPKERLMFSISTNHIEHLQVYQQADIILDPFPHTGGVVGLEQLYMGVPIITRYGTQPAGRTTSAVLTAMGRTEWIGQTVTEYIDKAVNLANDIPTLTAVRKTLRKELMESPVMTGYCAAVEDAYKDMWRTYCK